MGVNLQLHSSDGHDHPTWEWARYAGDSKVLAILHEASVTASPVDEFSMAYRPVDVEAFRARLLARIEHNHERWHELCDILRDQPEYYIYFSM